jgi:hypothetical protein
MQWECGHFTPTSTAHHHNRTHSTRAPAVITTLPAHNIRPVCPFIALSAVCTLPTHLLSHSPLAANAHTHPCTHAHDQPAFLLSCIHSPSSARRTRIGDDERLKSNIHGIVFFVHKGVKYLAVAQNTEERVLVLGAMPPPLPPAAVRLLLITGRISTLHTLILRLALRCMQHTPQCHGARCPRFASPRAPSPETLDSHPPRACCLL